MKRAKQIFLHAIENLAPDAWDDYLSQECNGDEELRTNVERLLAGHQQPDSLFQVVQAASDQARAAILEDVLGTEVGAYKLIRKLGEGGFGVVYLAEQAEPIRRTVALKILKPGMDTREVIARFDAERQALALMNHEHIAHVLDGGATDDGRPYFVMELVLGDSITEYCNQNGLTQRQRLELFKVVVEAVQHAHHKGVIHRDIKPSNVLVTCEHGRETPKVIDFGIAKAINQNLTDMTLLTRQGQFIGTPQYSSPEQAETGGRDIDTRSDIYSLGALLYELLAGVPPFETERMHTAGLTEVIRIICEEQPPRPSQRIKMTGSATGLEAVDQDLDWVVMKALEKERDRRYESASALASDLSRYLRHETVIARPPSLGYQLSRFAKRHVAALATGLAFLLVLVSTTAVSVFMAHKARHEAERASRTLQDLQNAAPAFFAEARALAAEEQFDEAVAKLDYAITLQPDNREYLLAKADLLECQFDFTAAAEVYRHARLTDGSADRAVANLDICNAFIARGVGADGTLPLDLLGQLYALMQSEGRPATQLMPIARLLGDERNHLLAYWRNRLQKLAATSSRPLRERVTLDKNGELVIDLSGVPIQDLSAIKGAPVRRLSLQGCEKLVDISGLADLPLLSLNLSNTQVHDLTPLAKLSLESLTIKNTRVASLAPLAGMPLDKLNIGYTDVVSLEPLRGVPLRVFSAPYVTMTDLSPLGDSPVEDLAIAGTDIGDLGLLRGLPLKRIDLTACKQAHNFNALLSFESLEVVRLPDNAINALTEPDRLAVDQLHNHPSLKRVSDRVESGVGWEAVPGADEFWSHWNPMRELQRGLLSSGHACQIYRNKSGMWVVMINSPNFGDLSQLQGRPIHRLVVSGTRVADLSPLSELPTLSDLRAAHTMVQQLSPLKALNLETLDISNTPVQDISPLSSQTSLGDLKLRSTPIQSLKPLQGLSLRALQIPYTAIDDLGPLEGMPLESVILSGTRVQNLSPLVGPTLRSLYINATPVTDLRPLANCPNLEMALLPAGARDLDSLKRLPRLGWIEYGWSPVTMKPTTTAKAFWEAAAKGRHQAPLDQVLVSVGSLARSGRSLTAADVVLHSIADSEVHETVLHRMVACALLVASGEQDRYRETAQSLLDARQQLDSSYAADQTLKAAFLTPTPVGTPDDWEALWALAETNRTDIEFEPWLYLSASLRAYRQGRYAEAIEQSRALVHRQVGPLESKAAVFAVRSMSHGRMKNPELARQALKKGESLIADFWPYPKKWSRASWHDWLIARLLLDEAAAQLNSGG